jgi:hypothetical protein
MLCALGRMPCGALRATSILNDRHSQLPERPLFAKIFDERIDPYVLYLFCIVEKRQAND